MKHPDKVQERTLNFGKATLFYPQASAERTTVALQLEIDPVALSRSQQPTSALLEPYVNDRPYASGSFLAVALLECFRTAMTGHSRDRPQLAELPLPLRVDLPCVAVRGPVDLVSQLFAPLGYWVEAQPIALDPLYPEWGERPYQRLTLSGTVRLSELLEHLYVLLPVLDGKKHYYIAENEVEKLLRRGEGWLEAHPERDLITARYLQFRPLIQEAQNTFAVVNDEESVPTETSEREKKPSVHDQRLDQVAQVIRDSGAKRVLDLGCGEGKLLRRLLREAQFSELVGLDLSSVRLEVAARKLKLSERPELARRIQLLHGSLSYPDRRLVGYDAAALVEVIEHLEPHRLPALSENVFGYAQPRLVVVTTPNREFNATFDHPQTLRHGDHRFEWSRAEFQEWAKATAQNYGYDVTFQDLGEVHPQYGPLTQMAVFSLRA